MTIYLYIKQHTITGLKYFGKTIKPDPFKYLGSGIHWQNHIKKHGKQYVQTLDVFGFSDQELATSFALKFSKDNNIAESLKWANAIPENARPNNTQGLELPQVTKDKISKNHHNVSGSNNPMYGKIGPLSPRYNIPKESHPMYGKTHSDLAKAKMSAKSLGRHHTLKTKIKISKSHTGKQLSEKHKENLKSPKIKTACVHCGLLVSPTNMKRWHGNNCKRVKKHQL